MAMARERFERFDVVVFVVDLDRELQTELMFSIMHNFHRMDISSDAVVL